MGGSHAVLGLTAQRIRAQSERHVNDIVTETVGMVYVSSHEDDHNKDGEFLNRKVAVFLLGTLFTTWPWPAHGLFALTR